ncbi:MAG: Rrf2 family transcriptional regulator [Candidatus Komeilibacteria bacterium]|nr:Rrf2 family transcriptional regulator [Candidatus Komeilibacteria bacterium]
MFHITTKFDYGLILLRSLAERSARGPISLKIIAREHHLPYHYLAQIATPLKTAGIITSREGVHGGYELARKPSRITLKEVSAILVSGKKGDKCLLDDGGVCRKKDGCSVSPWWGTFNRRFQRLLQKTTIADLI